MRKFFILGALAAGIAISCVQSPSIAQDTQASPAKSTRTIILKQADAKYMMFTLGIDEKTGHLPDLAKLRTNISPNPELYPFMDLASERIDSVALGQERNSLVITGEAADVEKLAGLIDKLDIRPKQVQIKAEFYEIGADKASRVFAGQSTATGTVVGSVSSELRKTLAGSGAKMINAPIISTLNNMPATLSIKTAIPDPDKPKELKEVNTSVAITPGVMGDKTINLTAALNVPVVVQLTTITDKGESKENLVKTTGVQIKSKIKDGESVLAFTDDQRANSGKRTFVIITATIVK